MSFVKSSVVCAEPGSAIYSENIIRLPQFSAIEPPVAFFQVGQSETAHHLLEELFHSTDLAAFFLVGGEPPSSLHALYEDGFLVVTGRSRS